MLTACAACSENVHFHFFRTYIDFDSIINLRHYFNSGKGSVASARGIERRDPYKTVYAGFRFKKTVRIDSFNQYWRTFDTGFVSVKIIKKTYFEIMAFCPSVVHSVKHFRPVLRFRTACACMEGYYGVFAVIFAGKKRCKLLIFKFFLEIFKSLWNFFGRAFIAFFNRKFC